MADPAEFAPADLDRIEDALEFLERDPGPDEPSYAIRQRLADYRQIAALSRAAMPMVEPPRHVLEQILARAHEACELPSISPAVEDPPRPVREGLWTRVRRFVLVPGVAVAGTAAIVLIMVQQRDAPTLDQSAAAPASRIESRGEDYREPSFVGPPAPAASPAQGPLPVVKLESAVQSDSNSAVERAPAKEVDGPTVAGADNVAPALGDLQGGLQEQQRKAASTPASPAAPAVASPKPVDPASPRWDIIARGDRARHKSDCDLAASEYRLALDDPDTRVRARAQAGLGLCKAANGDTAGADAAYQAARELDPEILAFIEDERPRGAGANSGARTSRAKKAKASSAKTKSKPRVGY